MSKKTKPTKATPVTNPAILPIEAATRDYADRRTELAAAVDNFNRERAALLRLHLPTIRALAAHAKAARTALEGLITSHASLFDEPRTVVLYGVKVGLQKGKGKVEFADEAKVVERIRAQFSKAEAELLLDVKVTPRKEALLTLDAAQLKKLGVTITGTGDTVVIKTAGTDIDKVVASILEEPAGEKGGAS